ncbi:MAG: hypothetical protein H6737_26420 [Alphaproteobacteria bacterium]|nr:hypothetical protein [Alphaproteobacteria bacterium]
MYASFTMLVASTVSCTGLHIIVFTAASERDLSLPAPSGLQGFLAIRIMEEISRVVSPGALLTTLMVSTLVWFYIATVAALRVQGRSPDEDEDEGDDEEAEKEEQEG